ncbi:hypothetical protein BDZ97DRAFT_1175060 [Flammula alnicola]|nr:hypothetical protein BDZ97DRAFT_1175060 [Flammula alnicola]
MRSINGHRQTRYFQLKAIRNYHQRIDRSITRVAVHACHFGASQNRCLPTPTPMDWIIILISFAVHSLVPGVLLFAWELDLLYYRSLHNYGKPNAYMMITCSLGSQQLLSILGHRAQRSRTQDTATSAGSYSLPPFLSYRGTMGIPNQPSSSQRHTARFVRFDIPLPV